MSEVHEPDLVVDIQVDVESEETKDGEREDIAGGQGDTKTQATSNVAAAQPNKGKRPHSPQTHVATALPRTRALTSNVWEHVTRFKRPDDGYPMAKSMRDLFEDYRRASGSEIECEASQTSQTQTQGVPDLMDEDCGDAIKLFMRHQRESGLQANKTELEIYLKEEMKQQGAAFDVLSWWKLNGPRFPILSCLARDVLAVLVSTVASESAFSTGGRVIDVYRSSLNSKMVQALICGQDWLKGSCEFDLEAESKDQTEVDNICLDLTNVSLEPNIDN
ncbi:hypothetical protein COLO4_04623 [Corchorus olitorius]|uniref:HAT C-terminal dimerisation domain-containing protein n=1 Tax=Corchorus olitorius TaxID=93759 RepID=A0A1R3KTE7_9ROSI|nr:hypothetical protein COLO4_04623 [Corchorus olitorius]